MPSAHSLCALLATNDKCATKITELSVSSRTHDTRAQDADTARTRRTHTHTYMARISTDKFSHTPDMQGWGGVGDAMRPPNGCISWIYPQRKMIASRQLRSGQQQSSQLTPVISSYSHVLLACPPSFALYSHRQ
mmetsp:Transcript_24089/g.69468  ORF Transcript_24089/g.69468 Transcript_24089/m.69468 type:complete len:134 (-) Transcript_24089:2497-2898(-)